MQIQLLHAHFVNKILNLSHFETKKKSSKSHPSNAIFEKLVKNFLSQNDLKLKPYLQIRV